MGFSITDTSPRCPECMDYVEDMEEHVCPKYIAGVPGESPRGPHTFETLDGDVKDIGAFTVDGAWRILSTRVEDPRRWIYRKPLEQETVVSFLSRHPDEDLLDATSETYHEHPSKDL